MSSTAALSTESSTAFELTRPVLISAEDFELPIIGDGKSTLPAKVTSADNIEVTITDSSRIIVLNEAIAEIVISLGFADNIIGRDATTTLAALESIPKVSSGHDISAESVLELRPTLVIGDTRSGPPEAIQQLRGAGVPIVLAPEVWQLSDIAPRIKLIADVLGAATFGKKLLDTTQIDINDALNTLDSATASPRVAFIYVRGTASVFLLGGKESGADEMIRSAGGIDVGTDLNLAAFTPLTSEAIVNANPGIIVVTTRGLASVGGIDGLLELPGIAQTPAAKSRSVVSIDDDLLFSFGPRTGELIIRLAQAFKILTTEK
ncbi:MAG: ABC transporter substrate-binding protein [Ilumatobacteraceae bacterium]|nr:ABC transporter substrate-binding protein [Ilumatobacteraceae bacterium]